MYAIQSSLRDLLLVDLTRSVTEPAPQNSITSYRNKDIGSKVRLEKAWEKKALQNKLLAHPLQVPKLGVREVKLLVRC